ncbi:Glucoside xylosyltransferase 2 [Picochlorum sp. SENEW3]|nr:Glucoside xylosyltransferase 2 [Picochlorum sp. SENEW3]
MARTFSSDKLGRGLAPRTAKVPGALRKLTPVRYVIVGVVSAILILGVHVERQYCSGLVGEISLKWPFRAIAVSQGQSDDFVDTFNDTSRREDTQKILNVGASSWEYRIDSHLQAANKCRIVTLGSPTFKALEDSKSLSGLADILRSLLLIPVDSTVVYVGHGDTGNSLKELISVLQEKEECILNVRLEIVSSMDEYAKKGMYKSATLVILDDPCPRGSVSSLGHILREGGRVFVGANVTQSCAEIKDRFVQTKNHQIFINPFSNPSFPEIWETLLVSTVMAMDLEGWKTLFKGMGHIGEVRLELQTIHSLLYQTSVKTHVCEIGFNAGHSAVMFLSAGKNIRLTSFDMGKLPWSSDMVERIHQLFPGQFTYIKGNSREIIPQYMDKLRSGSVDRCDIMFVDGDHSYEGARIDFTNSIQIMSQESLLIADDYSKSFPGVIKAWKELEEGKDMSTLKIIKPDRLYNGFHKGWSIGSVSTQLKSASKSAEQIHVATTQCGDDVQLLQSLVKSLILSSNFNDRIVFHLVANGIPEDVLEHIKSTLESARMEFRLHKPVLFHRKVQLFRPCALDRLMLPELLPDESHVIYLDRDTLVMKSLDSLYRQRLSMDGKAMGMVPEGRGRYSKGQGKENAFKTYFGTRGLNSGVVLMNLDLMRQKSITSQMFALIPEIEDLTLGDQDLMNYYFAKHPDMLTLLPCAYNYRVTGDGKQECECYDIEDAQDYAECERRNNVDDAVILHGNRHTFLRGDNILRSIWDQITATEVSSSS